jgi:hypothetical protein
MLKYFPIYEEAVSHIRVCSCSILNFLIYVQGKFYFIFYQRVSISQEKSHLTILFYNYSVVQDENVTYIHEKYACNIIDLFNG